MSMSGSPWHCQPDRMDPQDLMRAGVVDDVLAFMREQGGRLTIF